MPRALVEWPIRCRVREHRMYVPGGLSGYPEVQYHVVFPTECFFLNKESGGAETSSAGWG